MPSNAYFLAKFRFDTAENEPAKNLQNFANFPNFANPNSDSRSMFAKALQMKYEEYGEDARNPDIASTLHNLGVVRGAGPLRVGGVSRRVVAKFWQTFGKMLLVFGCIGTDFCKKIRILQHFSKSTRLSI